MCNFYGCTVKRGDFIRLKQIEKDLGTLAALDAFRELYNGFNYGNAVIVRKADNNNDIDVSLAHWEFIPPWIKDEAALKEARKKIPWLNAKSETLLESKMWRPAALKRRCLVLATHFYEWRHYKPDGATKEQAYPYFIRTTSDYFYMAGIWNPWVNKDTGETIDTFAIVTTAANDLMEVIHNKKKRQPTILPEDLAYRWIMEDLSEEEIQRIATYQFPTDEMDAYTIAKDFKTVGNPSKPFTYKELPVLDVPS